MSELSPKEKIRRQVEAEMEERQKRFNIGCATTTIIFGIIIYIIDHSCLDFFGCIANK
ncbi:hypothetical protein [Deinococcus seoulensis]|uniref:hypothetical protein n=1 Tax=Deinococcus seoulensis TaxID=1837379 RepID=UPI0016632C89|nr:hypothetical protein [Deinococcus seoulensis]